MSVGLPSFPYPGGKASLSSEIVKRIPRKGRKFVDVFGGRGNVTFRAIAEGLDYREWVVNDTNRAPFFRALRDFGGKFQATERTNEEYRRCAELALQGDPHALLMEPFLCFEGGTYATNGPKGVGGGRRTPQSHTEVVRLAHRFLRDKSVRIADSDWLDCLESERLGADDFVMIDAPYLGCNVGAYSAESICPTELIEYLKSAKFNWAFTEYCQPLYVTAFGEPAFKKDVQLRSCDVQKTREKSTECIWTNIGKARSTVTVTVDPVPEDRTQTYYPGLSESELLKEIKECIGAVGFSRNQMNREVRERLFPALLELKKRTCRKKPGFYETLATIGLNADTVRQWFYRSNTADEAIDLLEENKPQPPPRNREDEQSTVELLLAHVCPAGL
ncbi:MAG: DNA adenine methylase [Candidatus Acidiferrales bacterium]